MPAARPRFLLDTSVFSQPLRKQPDLVLLNRWNEVGDPACAVSIVTLAEVEWGLHKAGVPRWWTLYREHLQARLPVLPTPPELWSDFARLKARQSAAGRPVSDLDLLIAATALHHGLILVTQNLRHFALIDDLALEDWSAST